MFGLDDPLNVFLFSVFAIIILRHANDLEIKFSYFSKGEKCHKKFEV